MTRPAQPDHEQRTPTRPWAGLGLLALLIVVGQAAGCNDYGIVKPGTPELGVDAGTGGDDGDTGLGACGTPAVETDVAVNEACVVEAVAGTLDPVVEWRISAFTAWPESDQVVMAPVVGHLTDDNGDGLYDRSDQPDIVVITDDPTPGSSTHGILRVVSGADGSEIISIERPTGTTDQIFPYRYSNVALGDIDADGRPEIVTIVQFVPEGTGTDPPDTGAPSEDTGNPIFPSPPEIETACRVAAFEVDGSLDWVAEDSPLDCGGHAPALADLDADGAPEVIVGAMVFNGEDGSLAWTGSGDEGRFYAYNEIGRHSVVGDLDGDGLQELITGRDVYEHDGSLRCTAPGATDGFTAVADLDGDGDGEIVLVGDGVVWTFDGDCSLSNQWALDGGGNGGPPTIGDLDQDGQPEIALPSATVYAAYETDGTLIWSQPVSDSSSHATGSLIFDFESDGQPEIVYADEVALYIFDGATGTVRLEDTQHTSRTLHDYPTVADVDGDSSVEIIVPNGGGHYDSETTGIYVLGSESDSWQSGREVWNQHAYSITNINDDLSIPAVPQPNWPTHNSFRSGDPNPVTGGAWPDAVSVADVCKDDCASGELVIDVAIANQGAGTMRSGVPLHAWYDDDGTPRTLALSWTDTQTEPGAISQAVRIRVSADEVGGRRIYLAADQDDAGQGYVEECEEGNNMLTIVDTSCD